MGSPGLHAFQGLCIRVKKDILSLEPVSLSLWIKWSISLVGVAQGCVHTQNKDMPDIAGPVDHRIQGDFGKGSWVCLLKEGKGERCGVSRKNRKIHAI